MTGSQKQSVIGRQDTRIKRRQGIGHQISNVIRDRTSESNIRTPEYKRHKGQTPESNLTGIGHQNINVIRDRTPESNVIRG